jgi:hypothetical protein
MLVPLLESGPRSKPGRGEFSGSNLGAVLLDKENSGATYKPSIRPGFNLRVILFMVPPRRRENIGQS